MKIGINKTWTSDIIIPPRVIEKKKLHHYEWHDVIFTKNKTRKLGDLFTWGVEIFIYLGEAEIPIHLYDGHKKQQIDKFIFYREFYPKTSEFKVSVKSVYSKYSQPIKI